MVCGYGSKPAQKRAKVSVLNTQLVLVLNSRQLFDALTLKRMLTAENRENFIKSIETVQCKMPASNSLANQIVNRCLNVTDKDNVTILVYPHMIELGEQVAIECFKKGADVLLNLYTDKYQQSYFNLLSAESLRQPSVFCRALAEYSTIEIWLAGAYDPHIFKSIPTEKVAANAEGEDKAHNPVTKERKIRSIGLDTSLVTKPRAKTYGFNFARWDKMMQAAAKVDYGKLSSIGNKLRHNISSSRSIRITAPNGTDLSLDVTERKWSVSDGVIDEQDIQDENFSDSIPAGNISVVPVETGANGKITFNTNLPFLGTKTGKLTVDFKGGRVVDLAGDSTTAKVRDIYKKSEGDKDKIAVLKLGFNPKAQVGFTVDEIVAGAVTVGFGGNALYGGTNKSGFYHGQTLAGATVEADGRILVKAGKILLD